MKFWNKIKKFFEGPRCASCGKEEAIMNNGLCTDCWIDGLVIIQQYEDEIQREARINEMVEAIRRASAVRVKQIKE